MIDNIKPPGRPLGVDSADSEPDFVPPEQTAPTETTSPSGIVVGGSTTSKKAGFGSKLHLPRTKKGWAIFAAVVVLTLAILGGGYYVFFYKKATPATAPVASKPAEPPKPTTVASNLTGVQVKPEVNQLPVVGVMIENSPDARPQSGLSSAGVVFEAVAEGGITRFLALFQTPDPVYVGPIRSVRPYYLDWALGFQASLAHVGGSPDALADIKSQGVRDLDQFANAGSYQRISTRYAPHNVYTTLDKLTTLAQGKGFGTSTYTSWARKTPKPVTPATATSIDMTISSYLYNTHYDYDAASNAYKRSEGGKPHVDEKSGAQITPNVLVVMVMSQGLMADRLHTTYGNVGAGKVYVFQDGAVQEGTWNKADRKSQVTFKDASGNPLKLNTGQTWVTVVNQPGAVVYK